MRLIRTAGNAAALTASTVAVAFVATSLSTVHAATVAGTASDPPSRTVKGFEKHPFPTHEHGIDHPSGAAYLESSGLVAIAETRSDGTAIALLKPQREVVVERMTVPGLTDAATLADDDGGTLAALEGQTLFTWPANASGMVTCRNVVHRFAPRSFEASRRAGSSRSRATNRGKIIRGR